MADEKDKQETEYWREAVRLVELHLQEQNRANQENQNKVVLLMTFCVSSFGFLYVAGDWDVWEKCLPPYIWIFGILAAVFAISVGFGIAALNTTGWGVPGADADYSFQAGLPGNFNLRSRVLLKTYQEYCEKNQKTLKRKQTYIKWSKKFGLFGIGCVFIILVLSQSNICAYYPKMLVCECALSADKHQQTAQ
ncbi:MAG: hypothetical protein HAW59_00170 [Betaproteobacteria bacterium]|nr:hypothetical protein [Betaproteobacteria bacterium]